MFLMVNFPLSSYCDDDERLGDFIADNILLKYKSSNYSKRHNYLYFA